MTKAQALALAAIALACSSERRAPAPRADETAPESTPVRVDPPAAAGALALNLVAAGESVLATWLEPVDPLPASQGSRRAHRLRFARLEADTWSSPTTIAQSADIVANWADVPSVAIGQDGALVAHWAAVSGADSHAYDVVLARSTDRGATWQRLGRAHDDATATEHGFVTLLPDRDAVRAFWLDGREMATARPDGTRGPMTLRTALVGTSVTAGEVVDPRVCDCCGTSAAVTADGPVIAYRDRSDQEVRDIWIVRQVGGRWLPAQAVHTDGWRIPGCPVNGPAIAARGRSLAVAWYTYAGDRPSVRIAFSRDTGATFADPIEVDGPRGQTAPLGRVDLALDPTGEAVVSWMASDRERAEILVRRVRKDGRVGAMLTVAATTADRDAGFPRIEPLGDQLIVGWTETGRTTSVAVARVPIAKLPPVTRQAPLPARSAPIATRVGQPAPDYAAVSLDGKPVSLSTLRGRVVLVNLWATWCEPCRHELPELARLHADHARRGLTIVAVSTDRQKSTAEVRAFTERRKLPFSIWHDPQDRASATFGAGALPVSLLVDKLGTVVWRSDGAVTADDKDLLAQIDASLGAAIR